MTEDWYSRRNELHCGMIFKTVHGDIVRLVSGVPGDATKWYVDDWSDGWFVYDSTIEPGDLVGDPMQEVPNYKIEQSPTKEQEQTR